MNTGPRRIAVLGAPGTGAATLAQALRTALPAGSGLDICDATQADATHSFALLIGLDPVDGLSAQERQRLEQLDSAIRQQLHALGLPHQVVYGAGAARLNQALLALGLPSADLHSRLLREQAQFDLNRGRTPWSCEKCSDPDCEHRLFTGLLGRTEQPAGAPGPA